jgi:hypothetical protein
MLREFNSRSMAYMATLSQLTEYQRAVVRTAHLRPDNDEECGGLRDNCARGIGTPSREIDCGSTEFCGCARRRRIGCARSSSPIVNRERAPLASSRVTRQLRCSVHKLFFRIFDRAARSLACPAEHSVCEAGVTKSRSISTIACAEQCALQRRNVQKPLHVWPPFT